MSFEIILVFVVIVFLIVALYSDILLPSISFLIAVTVLTIGGVITPKDALSGFANDQLAVIVMLLVLSGVVRRSAMVEHLFNRMFHKSQSPNSFKARMMGVVSVSSAFFNNTPLVAMMMPYVYDWCKKKKIAPSRMLIPLSYAAILGGCCTLIGTSTNLIVNGMAIEAGLDSLQIFDFIYVGLPMLVIGAGFLLLFGKALLPETKDVMDSYVEMSRKYLVETVIKPGSELIGKSITEAELRNLEGVFLVEIIRNEKVITPVSPEEKLEERDTLIFSGVTSAISELTKPEMGLSLPKACAIPNSEMRIAEVVISQNSRLLGQKIQDSDFRGQYDASVLAVHRNRENLSGKIGKIEIKAGDVLLVLAGSDFYKRVEGIQPFYFISKEQGPRYVSTPKMLLIVLGLVLGIILHAMGVFTLFNSLLILVGLVLIMGIMPVDEIRKEMDFNLIILLALGLAFGRAMIESGAADYIADLLLKVAVPLGSVGIIGGLFLITNLLSSYITNKAAVAIVFPVSIAMADTLSHDVTPYILVVCFGAAASFITPIGYQTNLMVYGPGRYSFKDFFRVGLPLTLLYMAVCVTVLTHLYF